MHISNSTLNRKTLNFCHSPGASNHLFERSAGGNPFAPSPPHVPEDADVAAVKFLIPKIITRRALRVYWRETCVSVCYFDFILVPCVRKLGGREAVVISLGFGGGGWFDLVLGELKKYN